MQKLLTTFWLEAIVVTVFAIANFPQDVGGIKGPIYETGFPLIFSASGLTEPSFSTLNLLADIAIAFAIIGLSLFFRFPQRRTA